MSAAADQLTLRLLSLNIQVGLHSSRYSHYVTQAWRHVVPSRATLGTLERIATLARGYDLVALQEADAGSWRTRNLNHVEHLAARAGFAHWRASVTRDLRPFAAHCLGVLSRLPLTTVRSHAMPGWLPGRGVLDVEVRPDGFERLRLLVVHLALGRAARSRQLGFLAALVDPAIDTIVMGDLNCGTAELACHAGLRAAGVRGVHDAHTFPSWGPDRTLDHVLVSPGVEVVAAEVLGDRLSDHLPLALEVRLRRQAAGALPNGGQAGAGSILVALDTRGSPDASRTTN